MRVALVYRSFHLGGSLPRGHVELARYLSSRGHDVHVYSDPGGTRAGPRARLHLPRRACRRCHERQGILGSRELRSFARNAASMLEGAAYDIVHTRAPSTWVGDVLHLPRRPAR